MGDMLKDPLGKFQTYQSVSSTGIIGIPTYNVKAENSLVIKTIDSGASNLVTAYGKIENEDVWNVLITLSGNETKTIDISSYDYVRFVCNVYGGSVFKLIVSGFFQPHKSSLVLSEWSREVVSIGTTPVALLPDPGQVYIRIVPLDTGDFGYGPDSSINATNCELFSKAAPIEITINDIVYIFKTTGTGNVVIYRGSA